MSSDFYREASWNNMNKYVGILTNDGKSHAGFIARIEDDHLVLAIPSSEMLNAMPNHAGESRQFGYHPGFFPRHRFFHRRIPFPLITSLFLLPFFI